MTITASFVENSDAFNNRLSAKMPSPSNIVVTQPPDFLSQPVSNRAEMMTVMMPRTDPLPDMARTEL